MRSGMISQLRWAPTSVLLLLLTGLTPPVLRAQSEQYAISGDDVAIYNLAGEVRLEPGTGSDVAAQVTRGGRDAARLKVGQGELQGRQTLRFIYPSDHIVYGTRPDNSSTQIRVRADGTFGDEHDGRGSHDGRRVTISSSGSGVDAHADLRIAVPLGRQVAIYLAVGKVAVSNVRGNLTINVSSAPVTTSGTHGELNVDVGSGDVHVTQADGDLSVDTGSGAVEVSRVTGGVLSIETGSGDVTASELEGTELRINTGSGNIGVSGLTAPEISLETGSGSVAAELRGSPRDVSVETGSGDVTLRVPPTVGAEVEIQSSSGDIETDFPVLVTRHARDHMTGTIGDGRGKISVETGSGGVKLVKSGR
jgi:lia operon protein LiaG